MSVELSSPYRGVLKVAGLTFNEKDHEYYYKGKILPGITGKIGKMLKKKFPDDFVEEGRAQGSHVHKAIETWIKTGNVISVHPAAVWAIENLKALKDKKGGFLFSEVLVSDFKVCASSIDIMHYFNDKTCDIFDTKAGVFSRPYVTLQLGVYKYFVEEFFGFRVKGCYCISTRDKEIYTIFPAEKAEIKSLLYK
jgi:hypothetical protein